MIILGIDPGSTRAGYGVIDFDRHTPSFVSAGIITTTTSDKNEILLELYTEIVKLIKEFSPQLIGMEKLFFMKNMKTATEVAQSRGVLTLAVYQHTLPLYEFSPSEIKLAITGYGSADKKMIEVYVKKTLGLSKDFKLLDDAFDALAAALVTGFHVARLGKIKVVK